MTFSQRGLKERRRNHWNIWHTDQALSGTHNCPDEVTRYSLSLVLVLPRRWVKWLLSEQNLYFTILVATGHKENIVFNRLNRKFQEAILIGRAWLGHMPSLMSCGLGAGYSDTSAFEAMFTFLAWGSNTMERGKYWNIFITGFLKRIKLMFAQ